MTDIPRIGLTPVPDDADIEKFLGELIQENDRELYYILTGMANTVSQTESVGEPAVFAYAKLLNFLASNELSEPTRIRLLAAAIWELI